MMVWKTAKMNTESQTITFKVAVRLLSWLLAAFKAIAAECDQRNAASLPSLSFIQRTFSIPVRRCVGPIGPIGLRMLECRCGRDFVFCMPERHTSCLGSQPLVIPKLETQGGLSNLSIQIYYQVMFHARPQIFCDGQVWFM